MTLRTSTVACLALAASVAVIAPAAEARWIIHNEAVAERISAPPTGTRANTCAGRLKATAGFGHFIDVDNGEDPLSFDPPPAAFHSVNYSVWKAPAGFTSFSGAAEDPDTGQVFFEDPDGTRHDATRVGRVTTSARTALPTPVPMGGDPRRSDNYLFTSAPIDVALTGVRPGNHLGLAPTGDSGSIFIDLTAIDCSLPVATPRVDVIPGSSTNQVDPASGDDLIPVRIFGSRLVNVRHITGVHLGEAAPVSSQPAADADGDGRADKVYVFRQGDADIQCLDGHVRVTGKTSDRVRFQRGSAITVTGC